MLTYVVEATVGVRKNENTDEKLDLKEVPIYEANAYATGIINYLEVINANGDDINTTIVPSFPILVQEENEPVEVNGIYARRFLIPVIVINCTSLEDIQNQVRNIAIGSLAESVKNITDYDILFDMSDELSKVSAINYNSYILITRQELTRYKTRIKQEIDENKITEADVVDMNKLIRDLEYYCTFGYDNGHYRTKSINCLDTESNPYYDLLLHKVNHVIDTIDEVEGFQYTYPKLPSCPFNLEIRNISSVDGERLFRYHLTRLARRGIIPTMNYVVIRSDMIHNPGLDIDELIRSVNYMNLYIVMDDMQMGIRMLSPFLQKLSQRSCICINWMDTPSNTPSSIFKDMTTLEESIARFSPNRFGAYSKGRVFTYIGEDIPIALANEYIEDTYAIKATEYGMNFYDPILIETPNDETLVTDMKVREVCHHNDIRLMMLQYTDNQDLYKFLKESNSTVGFDDLPTTQADESSSSSSSIKHLLGKIFKSNTPTIDTSGYDTLVQSKVEPIQNDAMDKLDALIGLDDVKKTLKDIVSVVRANKKYKELGIKPFDKYFHMVFYGNPGTAKTTVGRLCASIFAKEGLIKTNKYTELGRADLIGQYVGHTADKVVKCFERGRGGVIFIDEAYSLVSTHESDYGREAINTIVQLLEDYREDTIVIFAGYGKPMDTLLNMNPGLRSRISYNLQFKDYTTEQLLDILRLNAEEYKFSLDDDFIDEFKAHMKSDMNKKEFGNGRYVRDVFQRAIVTHSSNIMNIENVTNERVKTITKDDYPADATLTLSETRVGFR